jgi:ABC-type nitrate/sulfonate/bicarbonate transport system substrate-binding protein
MRRQDKVLRPAHRKISATLLVVSWLSLFAAPAQVVAQDRVKFPVGVGNKTLGTGLIWLAAKKGFFEEFAFDVQPILLRGTPVAVQALKEF